MRLLANIISWVFVPIAMPIYTLLILFNLKAISLNALSIKNNLYDTSPTLKVIVFSVFFILIFLAPGLSLVMMRRKKKIESIELDNQNERSFPILITGFYSLLLALILFRQLPIIYFSSMLHGIAVLGVVTSIVAFVLTKYSKISLHAMGASLMLGTLICYYEQFYIPSIFVLFGVVILGGLIMSARYYLNKHTLRQLIGGYLIGLFLSIIIITFVSNFV